MSDEAKRYNGWANYETWCVHLWLTNDEGSYQYWREEAERCRSEAPRHSSVRAGLWTVAEAARFTLADAMKESFETFHPFRGEHLAKPRDADVYADLLDAALSDVEWSHIAESFLEEMEPEPEEGEPSDENDEGGKNDQGDGPKGPVFPLGRVMSTPGALEALTFEDVSTALLRHVSGDWGDVPDCDRQENDLSVREGFRILSVYRGKDGRPFWIITEADRSTTTVLLPDEY